MKTYFTKWGILFFFSALMLVVACRKDPPIYDPGAYKTTGYIFKNLPGYVPPVYFADNPITVEGVTLGRRLFYDSTLSKDNTVACASCHYQQYAFTDRGRQYSLGVNSVTGDRNAMALFNIAWQQGPFFWDGRAHILDSQIVGPVPNPKEMNLSWPLAISKIQERPEYPEMFQRAFGSKTITKENTVKAIAQFLRTITSFHSRYDSMATGLITFTDAEKHGMDLFFSDPISRKPGDTDDITVPLGHRKHIPGSGVDCGHCHAPPLFMPEPLALQQHQARMNNGVSDSNIKVPSLRNLKYTAPYMHDGSMPNLDSVIAHYDHEIDPNNPFLSSRMFAILYTDPNSSLQLVTPHMELTKQEIADLKAFLNTLNDNSLITNKAYGNPFVH